MATPDYATTGDVALALEKMNYTLDANSTPVNTAEAELIINSYEGTINAALKVQGYSVPVPAADVGDVAMLKELVANRVAAEIFLYKWSGRGTPVKIQIWLDLFNGYMTAVQEGKQGLADQTSGLRTISAIQGRIYR